MQPGVGVRVGGLEPVQVMALNIPLLAINIPLHVGWVGDFACLAGASLHHATLCVGGVEGGRSQLWSGLVYLICNQYIVTRNQYTGGGARSPHAAAAVLGSAHRGRSRARDGMPAYVKARAASFCRARTREDATCLPSASRVTALLSE